LERLQRVEVHSRVFAYGGVRTGASLDTHDALRIEDASQGPPDVLGVLSRDDVVRDDNGLDAMLKQPRDELLDERRLPRADRPADPDPKRAAPAAAG